MLKIERIPAKITSVTPISEKHGKKRRPAQSIIFEMLLSNDFLAEFDPQLRPAFYQKRTRGESSGKQLQADLAMVELCELKFPWMVQAIEIPGKTLMGYQIVLHIGASGKGDMELEEVKIDSIYLTMKDGGNFLFKAKALVHPTPLEKGRIEEMLQTEVVASLLPPESTQQEIAA